MLRLLATFILFISTAGLSAAAEPVKHDMSAMWKSSLAREQLSVGATFDARGALWLAQVRDGHLWVSHSPDRGRTFSAPVQVNAQPEAISANAETRPKIFVAGNGNVYLAWTQSLEVPFAGNIRFSRSVDGGKTFSAPLTVNDDLQPITHRFEAMGVTARGQIYLAWLDKRDAQAARSGGGKFSGISVYSAMSDDNGKSFHPNVRVAAHTCECCRLALAIDRNDTPVLVWRHIFGSNIRDHGLAHLDGSAVLNDSAVPQRVTFDNWQVEACPHHGPSLSIAGEAYHLAWFNLGSVRSGVFYARSTDAGNTFSAPLALGNPARQPGHAAVLAVGKAVYLAWKEFDGVASSIQAMISQDGGSSWSAAQQIADTRDDSEHPLLLADKQQVYLSWNTKNEGYRLLPLGGGSQ